MLNIPNSEIKEGDIQLKTPKAITKNTVLTKI